MFLPHPRPKRRWHQYSLRTLLVGTTLVAVTLGTWTSWIAPAERQRSAVLRCEAMGGHVGYDSALGNELWVVRQFREWLPRDYFDVVESVDIYKSYETEGDLSFVEGLPRLKVLRAGGRPVRDPDLQSLGGLIQLEELYLNRTQISDAGVPDLQRLTHLRKLNLSYTHVTAAGAERLQKALPNCEIRR